MSSHELTVELSYTAIKQLEDIYAFGIERWGERQAISYQERILRPIELLRLNPQLGRARDEMLDGVRSFLVERHIVYYRVGELDLLVMGIYRDRADLTKAFRPI